MKNFLKSVYVSSVLLLTPVLVFAQVTTRSAPTPTCSGSGIGVYICKFHALLNAIVPMLLALGVVYFVWGVISFMIANSEEAKSKGKDQIIYGVIGFVAIVGLWGLVSVVVNTFGLSGTSAPTLTALTGPASTCSLSGSPKLQDLMCYITRIINDSVIPLIFTLAVAMFVWGVTQFVINDSEEAKSKGKQFMIWGIIGLTVMISVWGLVKVVGSTFNLNTSILPQVKP